VSLEGQVLGTLMGAMKAASSLTSFSACSIPLRKSTLREYSLITSEAGLL
jgi:hypothetical protein